MTDSVKLRPNVRDIAAAGEDGVVTTDAPGGSTSMFRVEVACVEGPLCEDVVPVAEFCAIVTMRVPVVLPAEVRLKV